MNTTEPEDITVECDENVATITITMSHDQADRLEKEGHVKLELARPMKCKLLDASLVKVKTD